MNIISVMNKTTCVSDPFPTKLLMSHLPAIVDIILGIVNLCFESAVFPLSCKSSVICIKSSVIIPLIKKPGLDSEVLKKYRPVANLPFLSKVIEKAIAIQIHNHLSKTGIIDDFQSAYKAGHSCETALLRVFNDIASTIGKGNGNLLVLLDLSAAFDTIDHVILFAILKKYLGFDGNALKLIMSYFSDRTQRYRSMAFSQSLQVLYAGFPKGQFWGP